MKMKNSAKAVLSLLMAAVTVCISVGVYFVIWTVSRADNLQRSFLCIEFENDTLMNLKVNGIEADIGLHKVENRTYGYGWDYNYNWGAVLYGKTVSYADVLIASDMTVEFDVKDGYVLDGFYTDLSIMLGQEAFGLYPIPYVSWLGTGEGWDLSHYNYIMQRWQRIIDANFTGKPDDPDDLLSMYYPGHPLFEIASLSCDSSVHFTLNFNASVLAELLWQWYERPGAPLEDAPASFAYSYLYIACNPGVKVSAHMYV
jgi:hypothetical protein